MGQQPGGKPRIRGAGDHAARRPLRSAVAAPARRHGQSAGIGGRSALGVGRRPTDTHSVTGSPQAAEPTDSRRVIRLPRATRLLAAWLVCAAVAVVIVWVTPLNLEHGLQVYCSVTSSGLQQPCPDLTNGGTYWPIVLEAQRAALPILALRAAALGTVFWGAFLGVRVVLSRVRFTVG
jgi:hypothetical protein